MNISLAKVGIATYAWTAWFGKRAHSGAVYAEEVKRLVGGDGGDIIAICADNTSSNTPMTKGVFGVLSELFQWFFLGCCVHAMDLLVPRTSQNSTRLRRPPLVNSQDCISTRRTASSALEPISSFWKCAILLVFVAQSMPRRCKSCMEFLFWVSMELYIPKTTKMASFIF